MHAEAIQQLRAQLTLLRVACKYEKQKYRRQQQYTKSDEAIQQLRAKLTLLRVAWEIWNAMLRQQQQQQEEEDEAGLAGAVWGCSSSSSGFPGSEVYKPRLKQQQQDAWSCVS
jgi:hypothetical protein